MTVQKVDSIEGVDQSKQERGHDQSPPETYSAETKGSAPNLVQARLDVSPVKTFFAKSGSDDQSQDDERNMNQRVVQKMG